MKFYTMFAQTEVSDYVMPGPELKCLKKGCEKSEFQFLDKSPLECSLADGGLEFPDFLIYDLTVPLISELFKQELDKAGVTNLFYKPIVFVDRELLIEEPFWLALPPRIDCLDMEKSVIEVSDNPYRDPEDLFREVTNIVIDESKVGNYQIFKMPYTYANQDIIVNENIYRRLKDSDLENINFYEL